MTAALLVCGMAAADQVISFDDLTGTDDPFQLNNSVDGVSFWTQKDTPGQNDTPNAWVHTYNEPATAFDPLDIPNPNVDVGKFLGDDRSSVPGAFIPVNFFMHFDTAITSLSLDLYDYGDYRVNSDGTDYAFLFGYTDDGWQNIDSQYTSLQAQGTETETMSVAFSAPVRSAALIFITNDSDVKTGGYFTGDGDAFDNGWGVDNVTFSVVPEPATMSLLGLGVVGLAVRHVRRKRS
jgi:hypothetical protein